MTTALHYEHIIYTDYMVHYHDGTTRLNTHVSISFRLWHSTAQPLPANQRKRFAFARDSWVVKHGCHYASISHVRVCTTNVQVRITRNGIIFAAFNDSRTTVYLYTPKVRLKFKVYYTLVFPILMQPSLPLACQSFSLFSLASLTHLYVLFCYLSHNLPGIQQHPFQPQKCK